MMRYKSIWKDSRTIVLKIKKNYVKIKVELSKIILRSNEDWIKAGFTIWITSSSTNKEEDWMHCVEWVIEVHMR